MESLASQPDAPVVAPITSREFWQDYWQNKKGICDQHIPANHLFGDVLTKHLPKGSNRTFIEIGGFPGAFGVFFKKYFGYTVSLLDYYIDPAMVEALCRTNGVECNIRCLEHEFLGYGGTERFDVVFSAGFIEHFQNIGTVVAKHAELAKPDGYVVIGLPNFRGLNGLLQKLLDPENLRAHNLETMDPEVLKALLVKNGLHILHAGYYGTFGLWLENIEKRNIFLRKLISFSNKIGLLLFRKETRLGSPFILVVAQKPSS